MLGPKAVLLLKVFMAKTLTCLHIEKKYRCFWFFRPAEVNKIKEKKEKTKDNMLIPFMLIEGKVAFDLKIECNAASDSVYRYCGVKVD